MSAFAADIHHMNQGDWFGQCLNNGWQDTKLCCQSSCHAVQTQCEKSRNCVSSLFSSCRSCCGTFNRSVNQQPPASSKVVQAIANKALGALPKSQQMNG